jgi:hypothetical protein
MLTFASESAFSTASLARIEAADAHPILEIGTHAPIRS